MINCQNVSSMTNSTSFPTPTICNFSICNFGCATEYNAFVFGNFYGTNDVQGRLAAGGNIGLPSHSSIGNQLFPDVTNFTALDWNKICVSQYGSYNNCDFCDKCGKMVLVSNGTIYTSPDSRVYFGNWLAINTTALHETNPSYAEYATLNVYDAIILNGTTCPDLGQELEQGFQEVYNEMVNLSQMLCDLPETGCIDLSNKNSFKIYFNYNPYQEVISINSSDLVKTTMLEILDFNIDATLVFNVYGDVINFENIDLSTLENIAGQTVWNFCGAKTLSLKNIAIWGTILAPQTDIIGGPGQINGQVFANNFNCSAQIGWVPFTNCFSPCDNKTNFKCNAPQPSIFHYNTGHIMIPASIILVSLFWPFILLFE